ncbi:MAG: phospholipid carrier-dependent glycosyltransferase [Xanthomonadales bacterium]|nr:phospholipid carrier-dependent glycosyltransferase [Xanthomonadales bacterium]
MNPSAFLPRWMIPYGIATILVTALLVQLVAGIPELSTTYDETTHLPSGYSYLETGDFGLNAQHPPLIKLLAAGPRYFLKRDTDFSNTGLGQPNPNEWAIGYQFLYGNDTESLLLWGRVSVALLAVLLSVYVFAWASKSGGAVGGLLALALCAFSPTIIGHGRLVTFDVPLACFMTATLYHLWRYCEDRTPSHLLLTGTALGLALASKYSGLMLVPIVVLLLGLELFRGDQGRENINRKPIFLFLTSSAVIFAIALVIIQASYFFSSDLLIYWKGLARIQQDHFDNYPYYLMGQFREGGWWYYHPLAFLLKTPATTLLLAILAFLLSKRFPPAKGTDDLFLLVPILFIFAVTSAFADNLGVRYLIPVLPLMFVYISRLARWMKNSRAAKATVGILLTWYTANSVAIFPDQLSYFNEFTGGASSGHLYLDDSNIDWGQDLVKLKRYMDENGVDSVRLHYGNNVSPQTYGINAQAVTNDEWMHDPAPGLYAFGTNILVRGRYYSQYHGLNTDWLSRFEPVARVGYSLWIFEIE